MKKLIPSVLAMAALVFAAPPAGAQEEAPQLVSIGTLSVVPSQVDQFAEIVGKVVEAAGLAVMMQLNGTVTVQLEPTPYVSKIVNAASIFTKEMACGRGADKPCPPGDEDSGP